ncbi:4'-phosphopantetheinyl transferase superfamily protein [Pseudophaeobacter sp.]|uniref:4'-phosphopantetheinyl transferase family protein n=1 Tax=Pseudophaeobacter sp. TaxID=1971739 RepID=UPI00260543A9|nr:4'-phosphopantetheinyl transferase superfamily protein [Pseudophaeobacter sp.]
MRQGISLFLCPVPAIGNGLLSALMAGLHGAERQRARCFSCVEALHLFVVAHAALHWALRRAGVEGYRFACAPQGKPYLVDHPDLQFNLSHTKGLIAVALGADHPIGVDVERLATPQTYRELAPRVMTPAECAYMAAQAGAEDRFTQLWAAKEALMKATGLGFGLPPREIEFDGPAANLCRLPPEHGAPQDWQIWCQRLPGHWLALASQATQLADRPLQPITLSPQDLLLP